MLDDARDAPLGVCHCADIGVHPIPQRTLPVALDKIAHIPVRIHALKRRVHRVRRFAADHVRARLEGRRDVVLNEQRRRVAARQVGEGLQRAGEPLLSAPHADVCGFPAEAELDDAAPCDRAAVHESGGREVRRLAPLAVSRRSHLAQRGEGAASGAGGSTGHQVCAVDGHGRRDAQPWQQAQVGLPVLAEQSVVERRGVREARW
mmetsp:Transcript_31565/g.101251  ORF Transcript_31565/g.101251 Transcript_31565/m.101251 type:complete len:205 (-) Transcript_31565:736-1350(-)